MAETGTTGRELDAGIGRFMGLDVLGEVVCVPNPEDWRLEIPIRARKRETDKNKLRPVYLHHCVCEHRNQEDSVHFGHIWLCLRIVPDYSTDIAAAMKAVEKMRAQGWSFACTLYEGKLPYASFCRKTVATSRNAEAQSLPEAICRAALAAIDSQKQAGGE